jgi:hypothetical protein
MSTCSATDAAGSLQARSSSQWWIFRAVEIHLGNDVVVPDWAAWRRIGFRVTSCRLPLE